MNSARYSSLARSALTVCVFIVLFLIVDISELGVALSNITLTTGTFLMAISVLLIYISAIKWKCFLDAFGAQATAGRLFLLYLLGYFVNLILPSFLGGDAVRSWYLGKKVGQHEALTATILERYSGFVAMICLALVFMWDVPLVTVEIKITIILIALGLLVATVCALSTRLMDKIASVQSLTGLAKNLRKVQEGFHLARRNKLLLIETMALSFLFHSITVVNTMAAAYVVGWYDPPIQELFVVLPIILLLGALPITPSGLGVQEGAFLYFLAGIGATHPEALGVGIVLRAKTYVLALCGGLVWLRERSARGVT